MSRPPLSNYYGSSTQPTRTGEGTYSSSRETSTYNYPSAITGTTNVGYRSSNYSYSYPSSYSNNAAVVEPSTESYTANANYIYPRNHEYEAPDSSLNDAYSQNYYGRNSAHQNQQPQAEAEGLSNLAYVSGLTTADSRTDTTQTHSYKKVPAVSHSQPRANSPIETPRYSTNPPVSSTSYPIQQQASIASNSGHSLAVNAAAALAGAASRRYSNQQHGQQAMGWSSSAGTGSAVSPAPQRTASPLVHNLSSTQKKFDSAQAPHSISQPATYNYTSSNPVAHRQSRSTSSTNNQRQAPIMPASQAPQSHQSNELVTDNVQHTGSIASLVSAAHEGDATNFAHSAVAQSESTSTFIDPTAVFDPYHRERERKKQEAATHAKRKAEENLIAEQAGKEQERLTLQNVQRETQTPQISKRGKQSDGKKQAEKGAATTPSAPSIPQTLSNQKANPSSQVASSNLTVTSGSSTDLDFAEQEAMALELKSMMDKMKAFQTKDPSLFKKLWNDMRQPGGGTGSASIQSPSPQAAHQVLPTATTPFPQTQPNSVSQISTEPHLLTETTKRLRRKNAMLGPDGNPLHLNGYPVVVENNDTGLPDLGRFPAERRIRMHKYVRTSEKGIDAAATPDVHDPTVVESQTSTRPSSGKASKSKGGQDLPTGVLSAATDKIVSSASAATNAASGTIWPVEKRNALIATALKALKANQENAYVVLTKEIVQEMLESNPSYVRLCEMLEGLGLKFHRGHFARELLESCPELRTSMQKTPSVAPIHPPVSSTSTAVHTGQDPLPVPPPGYMVQYHALGQPPSGHSIPGPVPLQWVQGASYPLKQGHPPASPIYKIPKKMSIIRRPEPPPGSKEAAARKRDFSELIDMTELGDDDNYVVPEKYPRVDGPDSDEGIGERSFTIFPSTSEPPISQQETAPLNTSWCTSQEPSTLFNPQHTNLQAKKDTIAETKHQKMILAKVLQKSEALKKQYYDPKTVARDILIASGRHPSDRPLNVHLAGMLGKYIDLESDVSTFEWEEIDPGGPPIPVVPVVDILLTRPRYKLGERVNHRPKSRVVASAGTLHQPETDKRVMPAVSTGAVQQERPSLNGQSITRTKKPSTLRHSLLASDAHATPATFDPTRSSQFPPSQSVPSANVGVFLSMADTPPASIKKRIGRPPGAKNKYPSMKDLKAQAKATTSAVYNPASTGFTINIPQREARDKYKCKWRQCSTVLHNLDTLRKHIGKVHRPLPADVSFKGYECWWKKCEYLQEVPVNTIDGRKEWITTKTFNHWQDWLKHIEREHVVPVGLKYGDGPATAHIDPRIIQLDREKYCANKRNQEITPVIDHDFIQNVTYPVDVANLTEAPRISTADNLLTEDTQKIEKAAFIAYMRVHHNLKKYDDKVVAKEVIRAMEQRKRDIGPGVDRGGCTLVTQEMRESFEQNPGIRRVIDIDYK